MTLKELLNSGEYKTECTITEEMINAWEYKDKSFSFQKVLDFLSSDHKIALLLSPLTLTVMIFILLPIAVILELSIKKEDESKYPKITHCKYPDIEYRFNLKTKKWSYVVQKGSRYNDFKTVTGL